MARFSVIKMTDAAQNRVKEIMENNDAYGIIVGVKKGGCAGMEYTVDLAKDAVENAMSSSKMAHGFMCQRMQRSFYLEPKLTMKQQRFIPDLYLITRTKLPHAVVGFLWRLGQFRNKRSMM